MEGEGEEGGGATPGAAAPALLFLPGGRAVPVALGPPPGPPAQELLRALLGGLGLRPPAGEALALWLLSPLLEVQLQPWHRPLRLARQWPELLLRFSLGTPGAIAQDEPCLHLRRNVFFPKERELELQEEALLELLGAQAGGALLGGLWPIDPPEGLELGGLLARLRLGPFCGGRHTARGLRPLLGELLPPTPPRGGLWGSLLRRGPRAPPPEQGLLEAFARAPGPDETPAQIYRELLRRCHRLPYYGCAFFPGAIERPSGGLLGRGGLRPVSVAVGLEGVTIIDPREKHVLLSLKYPELSWELVGAVGQDGGQDGGDPREPPQLWLEFDGEHEGAPINRLLRVFSPQAELMSALIERCIELGAGSEPAPPPPDGSALSPGGPAPGAAGPAPRASAPWRPEDSVTRPRPQRLRTIDYVREGQELRRVKPPRRSPSFFGRGGGPYTPVSGGGSS